MESLNFRKEMQSMYSEMHEIVVKAKFYFLKVLQSATISDNKKNELRDSLIEISEEIKNHHNKTKYSNINNYNFEEYKKLEKKYLRNTKRKLKNIIKSCQKANPTRIKYNRDNIKESELDEDLGNSKIYGTRALERDKIININQFDENIIQNEVKKRKNLNKENKRNKIDEELIKIKTENFVKNFKDSVAVNPDIYYKAVKVIENKVLDNTKTNIKRIEQMEPKEQLNNNELYVYFDNYYNLVIRYRINNFYIKLELLLIDSIIENEIKFSNSIKSMTCIGEDEIIAELPINNNKRSTVNTFNVDLNSYLEDLEIRMIYDDSISKIREKINMEKNKEKIEMEKAKTEINKKLNEML